MGERENLNIVKTDRQTDRLRESTRMVITSPVADVSMAGANLQQNVHWCLCVICIPTAAVVWLLVGVAPHTIMLGLLGSYSHPT